MSRGPDRKQIEAAIRERLNPDERLEGIFSATVPNDERGGGLSFGGTRLIVMAVERAMHRAAIQKASQGAWVQLAPRMIIGLTAERLIIGRADRRWRLEDITGDLPLAHIKDVELGAASSRTRRVTLRLTNGEGVMLRMPRQTADKLRARLSNA